MTVAEAKYDVVLQDRRRQKAIQQFIKRKAVGITATIMVAIGIILVFLHLPAINPPLEQVQEDEGFNGVAVYGTEAVGMNETFEMVTAGPKDIAKSEEQSTVEEPTMTETDPDAPVIQENLPPNPNATKVVPKPNPQNTTVPENPKPKVDQNSLFEESDKPKGGGGPGGPVSSHGPGNSPGDFGVQTGVMGPGSWSLEGGSISYIPKPADESQVFGTIVVEIIVDRSGKVMEAHGGVSGTTVTNEAVIKKYENAAYGVRASSNPDGPERRTGKIKYNLRAN